MPQKTSANQPLEDAKEKVRQRILKDRDRVPEAIRSAFDYLAEHLFSHDFSVTRMRRHCRLSHARAETFRSQIGMMPKAYTHELKMDAVHALIRETDIEFWRLAHFVGYSTTSTFDAVYRKWAGRQPGDVREQARQAGIQPPEPPDDEFSWVFWIRATVGDLTPEEARWFLDWLHEQWQRSLKRSPQAVPEAPPEPFIVEVLDEKFRELIAEVVWETLPELTLEEQRDLVRGVRFGSAVLFDFLSHKIIPESRKDRQRGVEVAELALDSLEGSKGAIREDVLPNLRALGQARLGNALRLALRWDEAEQAFGRAEEDCQSNRERCDPRAEAEICSLEASLKQYQRRFGKAHELVDRAISLSRSAADDARLVKSLIQKASIFIYTGKTEAAFTPLIDAEELTKNTNDGSELRLFVYHCFASVNALVDDHEEAARYLGKAEELCRLLGHKVGEYISKWIWGILSERQDLLEKAEGQYQEARLGFSACGEIGYYAVLSLDLAILNFNQGRAPAAIRLAAETIPVFELFGIHQEALVALELLHQALAKNHITLATLEAIRSFISELFPDLSQAPWSEASKK